MRSLRSGGKGHGSDDRRRAQSVRSGRSPVPKIAKREGREQETGRVSHSVRALEGLGDRDGTSSRSRAVRFSATAEDLEGASFAGQHDTFLDVRGAEVVLDRVRACMASLFTDRAVAYRARRDWPEEDVAMAVLVQEMVPAEAAGVLFTADPVSGHRRTAVVEAVIGSGDKVVAGEVEPDHARIDRRTGEILVVPSCGPGWTPLFLNAAALVAEVGGRISHGALVAREYGLPAVVSVAGATREIRTGQRLRVDGIRGVVEILGARAAPNGSRADVSAGTAGT